MTARTSPTRRTHWTTTDLVESIAFASGRALQVGHDDEGDYEFVVTREGCEYRARLTAVAR